MRATHARAILVVALVAAHVGAAETVQQAYRADIAATDAAPLIVIGRLEAEHGAEPEARRRVRVERTLKGEAPDTLEVELPADVAKGGDDDARLLLFLEPDPDGHWNVVRGVRGALADGSRWPGDAGPRHFEMFADWIAARAEGQTLAQAYLAQPAKVGVMIEPVGPAPRAAETRPPKSEPSVPVVAPLLPPAPSVRVPPAEARPLLFGYLLSDGRYGDYRDEVGCYTNLYHAWARRGYERSDTSHDKEWLAAMRLSLKDAATAGQKILLHLNLQDRQPGRTTPIDRVLAVAAPYWDRVVAIELADEPDWSGATAEVWAAHVREMIAEQGLADRMLGVVLGGETALTTELVSAAGIDFLTIEGYLEPPGSPYPQTNEAALAGYVSQVMRRLPQDKKAILLMMAYTRNGAWSNLETLAELQSATYRVALRDPRIMALTMFAYGRPSGTREYPVLGARHLEIARSLEIEACSAPPPIELRASVQSGWRPLSVNLVAEVRDAPSCGSLLLWDFGDGTRLGGVERCVTGVPTTLARRTLSAVHVYDRPGTFTPMLRFGDLRSSRPTIVVQPD